ncbi:MAG: cysteine desulfurase family protein [Propionicimonas sp.]
MTGTGRALESNARPIYFDHNATTPIAAEVARAMWPYVAEHFGNPSSAHSYGRVAKAAVDHAREQVAALIGARPTEIIFTSGGTEANNLAIRGVAALATEQVAISTAVEHPATTAPLALLAAAGWTINQLPVDADGRASAVDVPGGRVGLGSLILAQNEVGTIQPVRAIADAIHRAGGIVHTDAAQAVGKIPVDVDDLCVDLLSIAGHKLYAPKGVGALYVRRGTRMGPLLVGAGQESGRRPGTENVPGVVALGAACELAAGLLPSEPARQLALRELLWSTLSRLIPGLARLSPVAEALPNTLTIAVPGRVGADVLDATNQIAASTGSACHAGIHTPAATLLAMGIPAETAIQAIRLSIGRTTTTEEVREAAAFLGEGVQLSLPA